MRITVAALALIGVAAMALSGPGVLRAAPDDTKSPTAHPLYDDGGTLDWRTKWAEAAQIARERRRLIFVEWGRES